ncbi:HD-GYP domain-containing protein [Halothiobacillus sp. DCM-1]|uniref:HD-GYP domain-containing protein n=1 Tax=Halothiobacillus sp. DCM-1 TaxID=3112558 RepID=UPI003255C810
MDEMTPPTTPAVRLKPTLLLVDDTPDYLVLMRELLQDHYQLLEALDGPTALRLAADRQPDLILLDIMMPVMDGFSVCRTLKTNPLTSEIPVIFLTALSKIEDEEIGLKIGAVDYITKPISPPILMARINLHLRLKASADFLRDNNAFLESEVQRRTNEVCAVQDVTIMSLASLAETRDNATGNHLRRTQHYVRALAEHLVKTQHPRFAPHLTAETRTRLFQSAPLHDIGKVGIPDRILLKPGPLTPEEFEIMKTHTVLGRQALERAEELLGISVPFLEMAKEIAQSHQEKWDGSGYPEGLAGENIPLSARLMAVADVYDALISQRVYKKAFPHAQAVEIIRAERGRHFDPDLVDAFLAIAPQFEQIARQFSDADPV